MIREDNTPVKDSSSMTHSIHMHCSTVTTCCNPCAWQRHRMSVPIHAAQCLLISYENHDTSQKSCKKLHVTTFFFYKTPICKNPRTYRQEYFSPASGQHAVAGSIAMMLQTYPEPQLCLILDSFLMLEQNKYWRD